MLTTQVETLNPIEKLHKITSKINTTNQKINESISLLEIKDVTASFIKMREELEAVSVKSLPSNFMDKLKNISVLGTMVKKASDTAFSMKSVYSTLDSLFQTVEAKYAKLLEAGTSLQSGKVQLQKQIDELQILADEIEVTIGMYEEDVPLHLISAQTQIGTYLVKYRSRLINVEASLFAAKETIQQLGAYLPTFKSELNDELALSSLLSQVGDYQNMFSSLSTLVKEIGTINDTKTHNAIVNLLDIQINDTTTRDILVTMQDRSKKLSEDLVSKAEALHQKILRDSQFYRDVQSSGIIDAGLKKIKELSL